MGVKSVLSWRFGLDYRDVLYVLFQNVLGHIHTLWSHINIPVNLRMENRRRESMYCWWCESAFIEAKNSRKPAYECRFRIGYPSELLSVSILSLFRQSKQ